MHLQKRQDTAQADGPSAHSPLSAAQNLQDTMSVLLAALDAAEAAGDQACAERLITKIYAVMDLSGRLPNQDPA